MAATTNPLRDTKTLDLIRTLADIEVSMQLDKGFQTTGYRRALSRAVFEELATRGLELSPKSPPQEEQGDGALQQPAL